MTAAEGAEPGAAGLQRILADERPRLLRFLKARGAGDEAEDILQDVWQRVSNATGAPVADPISYLFRVAENLMRDRYRECAARERRERDWTDQNARHALPDGERMILARQRLERAESALAAIEPRAETAFRRFRLDGVGQAAIARELGVSLSTVEKDLQRAYAVLGRPRRAGAGPCHASRAGSPVVRRDRRPSDAHRSFRDEPRRGARAPYPLAVEGTLRRHAGARHERGQRRTIAASVRCTGQPTLPLSPHCRQRDRDSGSIAAPAGDCANPRRCTASVRRLRGSSGSAYRARSPPP
ncbi:hypothetical protein BH09PSE4_BH09PSE4_10390 [soil metagenome]